VALAFLVRDPIAFTIPKAARVQHVEEIAGAQSLQLSEQQLARIDSAFPRGRRRSGVPTL
jgi:diketogulonate reductase-like aldo/keto reductase